MWSDLRFAARQLTRNPAFTLLAVLSLALGAGVNSTIFSLLDGLYLRPLAVRHPENLIRVFAPAPDDPYGLLSYVEYEKMRRETRSFDGVATLMNRGARLEVNGVQKLLLANITSPDFFQVLGVQPRWGRLYGPGPESGPVAVLGYNAFHRYFQGDPAIVGRAVRLTNAQVTIIGVLPPTFRDTAPTGGRDLWVPPQTWSAMIGGSQADFTSPANRIFQVLARRKAGASLEAMQAEADAVAARLPLLDGRRVRFVLLSDLDWRLENAGVAGAALFAIVGLVVLTACVNVANLLLARADKRRREIGLRAALGAARWPVARLFLLECALLAILGLACGSLLSLWAVQALPALFPAAPGLNEEPGLDFRVDLRVFCATALVSLATLVLTALSPLIAAARVNLVDSLRGATSPGAARWPLRNILASAQMALSLVLLAAAGLLGYSFWQTRAADVGLTRNNPLVVWCVGAREHFARGFEQAGALPGVRRMAAAMRAPFSLSGRGMAQAVSADGHPELRQDRPVEIKYNSIDENYLSLMGQRIVRGRGFEKSDMSGPARAMLINQTMARRYWPDQDPIGRFVRAGSETWQIAGIVSDAPFNNIADLPEPYFYLPYWNATRWDMTLLIEPAGDRATLAQSLRRTLAAIHPTLEPASITSLDELRAFSANEQRMIAVLAASLASLGALLSAVGLYGVLSFTVSRRQREIGIRMALGAERANALALILRQSLTLAACGAIAGLPLALASARWLRSFLFAISPWHPAVLLASLAVLFFVAVAACLGPALRASRIDPALTLRME